MRVIDTGPPVFPSPKQLERYRREFGVLLRRLRLERGWSCETLAGKARKISRSTLATIERGQRQAGAVVSERLADALELVDAARRDFILAGLKTTAVELLPLTTKGLDPQLFQPIWQLLAQQNLQPAVIQRVRLQGPLDSRSPSALKSAALQLAERADRLAAHLRAAVAGTAAPFPLEMEIASRDGKLLLVQLLSAGSPPPRKRPPSPA